MWSESDLDEALTCEVIAERAGTRRSLVLRLAQRGLIDTVDRSDTIDGDANEPMVPRRVVVQLRRMQRLRRDLGVNFAGAAVIIDLVGRIEQLNRELAEMQRLKEEL